MMLITKVLQLPLPSRSFRVMPEHENFVPYSVQIETVPLSKLIRSEQIFKKSEALIMAKDYQGAEMVLNEILEQSEDEQIQAACYLRLGDIFLLKKQNGPARQYYMRVLDTPEGQFGMAMLMIGQEDYQSAQMKLEGMESDPVAKILLGYVYGLKANDEKMIAVWKSVWQIPLQLKDPHAEWKKFIREFEPNATDLNMIFSGGVKPYLESSEAIQEDFYQTYLNYLVGEYDSGPLTLIHNFLRLNEDLALNFAQRLIDRELWKHPHGELKYELLLLKALTLNQRSIHTCNPQLYRQAVQFYREALSCSQFSNGTLVRLCHHFLNLSDFKNYTHVHLRVLLQQTIDQNPNSPRYLYAMAKLLLWQFEKHEHRHPKRAQVLLDFAKRFYSQGNHIAENRFEEDYRNAQDIRRFIEAVENS